MTYAKTCKKGHFSKTTFHAKLNETFINLEAIQHENHHLTLREELT